MLGYAALLIADTPQTPPPAGDPPYVRRRLEEVPTRFGGVVKLVRADLGLQAFGVQVFDYPPGVCGPEHDESSTGQEELYVGLAGSGWIEIDGEPIGIESRVVIAVRPGTRRRPVAGPEGLSLLCVGGVAGAAYQPFAKFDR